MAIPAGRGRGVWLAVAIAAAWATVILAGAFLVPVYGTATYLSSGSSTGGPPGPVPMTDTVIEANGLAGAVEMAVPLMAALVVLFALRRGGGRGSLAVAWTATGLLALFNLLSLLTIGLLMIPVTVALAVACSLATRPTPGTGNAGT